jgi:hypothetical protein
MNRLDRVMIGAGFLMVYFAFVFLCFKISNIEGRIDNSYTQEYPKELDPKNGADSALIEQLNLFVEENVKLENYIKHLEQDNQILGSALASKEIDR